MTLKSRQKLTASILTFVMLFQIIAGIFAPINIFNLKKNEAHAGWFDMGYGYKKEIKVDHTKVANTDQTNFPMLVSFTDPALKTVANGGKVTSDSGYDIIFTNAPGTTKLDHEIEKYVPTTGEIVMWVKIPVLSASVDTSIYIYYGNAAITTTQENKAGVWDSNFAMVQHLKETGNGLVGDYKDSTSNGNNSTNTTNQPTATTGQVDGAEVFDGTNSYIGMGDVLDMGTSDWATSLWFKTTDSNANLISKSFLGGLQGRWFTLLENSNIVAGFAGTVISHYPAATLSTPYLDNNWHNVTTTYDRDGSMRLYLDGIQKATSDISSFVNVDMQTNTNLFLGRYNDGSTGTYPLAGNLVFSGSLDEVRISNTARSAGWISTEYNNQSQPTEFSTLGIEEVSAPAALSTFAYRKAITIDHTKVSGATNLTNFPVLINLPTDASLAAHVQSTGNDILFTSSTTAWNTGTINDKLAHEIETYTASNGSLQAWVNIPSLNASSASQDTVIYMYYGNATATNQQNKTAVWDTNTKMVQHMNQNPGGTAPQMIDSTQYANNGTSNGSMASGQLVTGQVDGATSFDGVDDSISVPHNSTLSLGSFSASAWVRAGTNSSDASGVISKIGGTYNYSIRVIFGSGRPQLELYDGTLATSVLCNQDIRNDNKYHYVVGTLDTNKIARMYLDGSYCASVDASALGDTKNTTALGIGRKGGGSINASIDEARVSNIARSADWISTEYNNQSQPTEFSSLGIEEVSVPVALSSFAYRKAITIDHTKVSGTTNLTNFPVLINLPTDASLAAHAQNPSGNDILFTSSTTAWNTGTTNDKLAHEIETYTTSTGSLQAWVKIPSLNSTSASQDTVIYMYYGNATATSQQNKTAVWDTNTKMVQHMNQTGMGAVGDYKDSTQYGNNSANTGSQPTLTASGQVGSAESFNGSASYIDTGNGSSLTLTGAYTLDSWIKLSGTHDTYNYIFDKSNSSSPYNEYAMYLSTSDSKIRAYHLPVSTGYSIPSSTTIPLNTWIHVTSVFNGTILSLYVNGILENSTPCIIPMGASARPFIIGKEGSLGFSYAFNGSIDEVRISNTARTPSWIATEHNNQSQPTEFSTLGIEEVSSPSALSSFAYRKAITIDHTKVSGTTNLTNFPVLINLPTDDSLRLHAQNPSGNDILFTSSSTAWNTGTTNDKLAHEIETYTASNGSLQAWVKIPSLNSASATQDTVIYMYYGNATATNQQNKTAVWDTNTKMVQHMNQTGTGAVGDYKDSTQYANNSTNPSNQPTATTGQVDGAEIFDGSGKYIDVGSGNSLNLGSITDKYTMSVWVKTTTTFTDGYVITNVASSNIQPIRLEVNGNKAQVQVYDGTHQPVANGSTIVNDGTWHLITGVIDRQNTLKIYTDGVLQATTTDTAVGDIRSNLSLNIGKRYNQTGAGLDFNGSLDEVRISNTARSAGWIATEYNNQSQPTEFSSLGIEEVSSPVALSSFVYRKAITIDHTKVSGTANLTNFPVLINLPTDDSLRLHAQNPSGNDILFTSSSTAWNTGTTNDKLAHEIETYTASNGSLQAWVKVPTLFASNTNQDTVIYMYYGNATATNQQNKTVVWDTNTKMVQHMNQNPGGSAPQMTDSTQYINNGTSLGGMTSGNQVTGQVDGGTSLDGSDDYMNLGSASSLNLGVNNLTLEAWIYKSSDKTQFVLSNEWLESGTTWYNYRLDFTSEGQMRFFRATNTGYSSVTYSNTPNNTWLHVVGTYNGSNSSLYVNGALQASIPRTGTANTSARSLYIGSSLGSTNFFNGSIDEVRISNTARSADWIATEYNNQSIPLKNESTPAGFLALGAEQIYRLEITGSATQTAGVSQPITLYAKDAAGNTMTNFTGDKTLTLGGASVSPNNTNPTCSDKNAADIPFGTPTTLTFANGVATCNMKLFKAETASVTSTGIATVTSDLSVTVSPNALNNFLVDAPASSNSGTAFATVITSRDFYNNTTTNLSGSTALSVNQGGTITPTSIAQVNFTDDGVWSGNLTITNITEQPSVAITATNDIYTGSDSISILGVPTTPQNASATRNTDYSMTLTWQDSSTVETGYKIERKENSDSGFGSYVEIGTVAAGVSTFTDDESSNPGNTPYPDRSYQYRVRAYNTIGNSAAYSEDSIIHYTTPDMPSNVFGSFLSDTSFRVNYTDNANVTDTHRIQRCSNANCSTIFETDLNTFTTSPQTDTTSLYPDSRYRWEVRAEAPSITSNYEVSNFEYTTPAAPVIAATTFVSNTQLNVNWQDTSAYEDGFRIAVSIDGGAYAEVTPGVNTVGSGITSYAFTSTADHNYKFKVKSHIGSTVRNIELLSAYSSESSAVYTTSNSPTMQAPTVISSTSILWNWTDNSAFEELFHLHFSTGSGTDVSNIPADSTNYETANLTPNTKYQTHIHSYRADTGESDPSSTSAEVYTFANIPSSLTLTSDNQKKIMSSWNANSNPANTKYYIENINTGANSDWTSDTSWESTELICGTEYSFRVKARNESSIETAYSGISTLKTPGCGLGLPIGSVTPPKAPTTTDDNPSGGFKVTINDNSKYTNSSNVKLTFFAGEDTARMAISNSQDFSQASIIPYAKEGMWDISANARNSQGSFGVPQDDGTYTVYVKFYTKYGAASQAVSDSIILDTTPPDLNITNLKAKYLTTDDITIKGTIESDSKVIYNLDSVRAGVIDTVDGKLNLNLGTLTAGTHSLKLIAQDHLGNSSDTMQLFLNVEKPIIITPIIPTLPSSSTTPGQDSSGSFGVPQDGSTPTRPNNPKPPTPGTTAPNPGNQTPTTKPPTPTPTTPASGIDNPDLPSDCTDAKSCVSTIPPSSMQGDWNLLTLKPFPKDITNEDIQMIIDKFPEFKETFRNLGLDDFTNVDKLKNSSFNIPSLSEVMGLSPTGLTALNLPNSNTPLSELSAQFKKEIPSNIVFIKTQENGIDVNSALSFDNGNANQKINLLAGQSFELVLRPDQDVNSIQGYITFKESKLSRNDNTTVIEKVAKVLGLNKSALADQDIEEKLVLSEFEYQDEDKDGLWTANIQTPQVSGEYELITVLNYKDIKLGSKTLRLITVVDPEGYVYRIDADGIEARIPNATVSIYWFNNESKKYEIWDAGKYQQKNPQTTDNRGTYSFLVPPGSYYLVVSADGYSAYQSNPFDVTTGSGVHMNLEIKRQANWKDQITWQNMLLVVFGIGLFYNFYSDRKKWKRLKKKEIV